MFETLQKNKCKYFNIYSVIFNLINGTISELISRFANKSK